MFSPGRAPNSTASSAKSCAKLPTSLTTNHITRSYCKPHSSPSFCGALRVALARSAAQAPRLAESRLHSRTTVVSGPCDFAQGDGGGVRRGVRGWGAQGRTGVGCAGACGGVITCDNIAIWLLRGLVHSSSLGCLGLLSPFFVQLRPPGGAWTQQIERLRC